MQYLVQRLAAILTLPHYALSMLCNTLGWFSATHYLASISYMCSLCSPRTLMTFRHGEVSGENASNDLFQIDIRTVCVRMQDMYLAAWYYQIAKRHFVI